MKHQMIAAVLFCFVPSDGASSAPSSVCLSHKEARQLWPTRHIYWYSRHHCWSNRRGPPRNIRYDLIRENHAEAANHSVPKIIDLDAKLNECCWPVIDTDANGNITEPPKAFAERIKDVPLQWWTK